MKIAINTLPLKNLHKYRGIGYYTGHLIENLKKDPQLEIVEFEYLSKVPDVEVIHYPWFDFFFHTLPIRRKIPTVVTIHDVIPLIFPKKYPVGIRGRINFMLQATALKSCRSIITDSKASKADIIKHLGIANEKVVVIHLAADDKFKMITDDTRLLRVKRKYKLPDRFLLYVGDANWVKNLPFLIEGFHKLLCIPSFRDLKLVLVGGVFLKNVEDIDHPELKSLKEVDRLIKQYGIGDFVVRPGQIEEDELVVLYNLATLYVQASFYEGFGLPLLQAFSCGTPVISSAGGSLKEIGGEAAVYFDPYNLHQFTTIAKELIENTSIRSKLSKLGLLQATKFSWKKTAEETKEIYLKVTGND